VTSITQTFTESATNDLVIEARARRGGPSRRRPTTVREDWIECFSGSSAFGSHMPLDVEAHWDWRNPVNIIPIAILLLLVIALVAEII
jgi:hypothetical protein